MARVTPDYNDAMSDSPRPPITDSFWFWVCLFATMALVALFVISRKYDARQLAVEQKAQGRMRAAEKMSGGEITTEVSSPGHLQIPMTPLVAVLGGILVVSWAVLWWHYFRRPSSAAPETKAKIKLGERGPSGP